MDFLAGFFCPRFRGVVAGPPEREAGFPNIGTQVDQGLLIRHIAVPLTTPFFRLSGNDAAASRPGRLFSDRTVDCHDATPLDWQYLFVYSSKYGQVGCSSVNRVNES